MNDDPRARVTSAHVEHFARNPEVTATAPGRVNLIGEHTDYNDGFVLPVAINYHTAVAASGRDDRQIRALAMDEQGEVRINLDETMRFDHDQHWSNYLRGIITELRNADYQLHGADLTISGNVPLGAGLSSSAALELALIRALTTLSGEPVTGSAAARMGQAAENNFVGCNCGIMDQLISALGTADHALLIDCRDLSCQAVKMPEGHQLLVINSNVKRQLVDGEYNARRRQCEAAAAHFGVAALRDLDLDTLKTRGHELDVSTFKRARHVITENDRTLATATALRNADMHQVAALMAESHASMRDDFEITIPEIDLLVTLITDATGPDTGVRMTGGGFGGCVIALMPHAQVAAAIEHVQAVYQQRTGISPTIFQCTASDGAFAEAT